MSIFPFPIFTNLSLISNLKDSNVNSISVRAWLWRAPSRLYLICRRLTGIKMIKYVGKVWITGSNKPVSRNVHKEEIVSTNKNSEGYNSKLGSKIKQHPNSNWSKNLRQVSHSVEFVPKNGKSAPPFFEVQYLTQESIFCKNSKRGTQNMDIASVL